MADIDPLGLSIDPSGMESGGEKAVAVLNKVSDASGKASRGVEGVSKSFQSTTPHINTHNAAFDRNAVSMARSFEQSIRLSESLGGLEGRALSLARAYSQLERMNEQIERVRERAVVGQNALNKAFQEGSITSATHGAAMDRLTKAHEAQNAVQNRLQSTMRLSEIALKAQADLPARVEAATNRLSQAEKVQQEIYAGGARLQNLRIQANELIARREKELADLQNAGAATASRVQAAQNGITAAKRDYAKATKEVTDAENLAKISSEGNAAAAFSFGVKLAAIVAIMVAAIAVFVAVKLAVEGIKKAWELMSEAVQVAARDQTEAFGFTQMVGNAEKARVKLEQLDELWAKAGIFKSKDVTDAAQQLITFGTGLDNLVPRIEAFADIAATTTGATISSIASTYNNVRVALEGTAGLSTMQLRQFKTQGIDLLQILQDSSGKTAEQIREMFKSNAVTIDMINKAITDATTGAGRYADAVERRAKTMEPAMNRLRNVWEQIQKKFAEPIVEAITPIITRIGTALQGLVPIAKQAGEEIGHITRALTLIAQEQGWKTALAIAWELVVRKMAEILVRILVGTMTELGPALGAALWESMKAGLGGNAALSANAAVVFGQTLVNKILLGVTSKTPELQAQLDKIMADAFARTDSANPAPDETTDFFGKRRVSPHGGGASDQDTAIVNMAKTIKDSDWEKYQSDIKTINDYWEEYDEIQSHVMTATERSRREMELAIDTAHKLYDPSIFHPYVQGLDALIRKEAEHEKAMQAMELRIKIGAANAAESFQFGIQKALDSWGNASQQMAKLGEDITNRIGDGFANALGDVVTGAKDAKTAFKEMAASILADIARMIIKMLILRAVQALIGGLGGGAYGSVAGIQDAGGAATGGPVGLTGEEHRRVGEQGPEFVFNARATRNAGIDHLYTMQAAYEKGDVPKFGVGGRYYGGSGPFGYGRYVATDHFNPNYWLQQGIGPIDPNDMSPGDLSNANRLGQNHYDGGYDPASGILHAHYDPQSYQEPDPDNTPPDPRRPDENVPGLSPFYNPTNYPQESSGGGFGLGYSPGMGIGDFNSAGGRFEGFTGGGGMFQGFPQAGMPVFAAQDTSGHYGSDYARGGDASSFGGYFTGSGGSNASYGVLDVSNVGGLSGSFSGGFLNKYIHAVAGHAAGVRVPAGFNNDNYPAYLTSDEQVIPKNTTLGLDRKFGRDWSSRLDDILSHERAKHFAGGGRYDSSSTSDGTFSRAQMRNMTPAGNQTQQTNTFVITTHVHADGSTTTSGGQASGSPDARQTGEMITNKIKMQIAEECRDNGIIHRFANGRR